MSYRMINNLYHVFFFIVGYHGSHHPGSTVYDHLSSVLNEMVEEQDHFIMV